MRKVLDIKRLVIMTAALIRRAEGLVNVRKTYYTSSLNPVNITD
jgi:hypothetical protein